MSEELEGKARAMGWKPEDEFPGDKSKFISAEDFVKRAENILPIQKENLNRLIEKLDRLEKEREEDKKIFQEFKEFTSKSEERAFKQAESNYKRELTSLKLELKKAAQEGDWDKFDTVEKTIDTLEKPVSPSGTKTETTTTASDPEKDPVFISWKTKNDWYGKDMEVTMWADSVGNFVRRMNPTLRGEAFFEEVEKQVKEKYANKFTNPNQGKKPSVETGSETPPAPSGGKKAFSDLPQKAKDAYDNFKKIMPNFTKEEYLKQYTWE